MTGGQRAARPWASLLRAGLLCAGGMLAAPAVAQSAKSDAKTATAEPTTSAPAATSRSGREIYESFRAGLADPDCKAGSGSPRWRQHFAAAPQRLATRKDDLLPLFGYVVDALRAASLPTEYALIPFIESGYKPGARSPAGPAGLWQMIVLTARNHRVPISKDYDGRLSPVDSTQAAVRYLKTLHGMFAGDWRLAVMAYNAGEYRILGALKRSGQKARNAQPEQLPGLSDMTHAYVRKLHALSCLMEQADDREDWLHALDRPVPRLAAITVPDDVVDLAGWATRSGQDAAQLQRLNPVFGNGRIIRRGSTRAPVLAIAPTSTGAAVAATPTTTSNAATRMLESTSTVIANPSAAPAAAPTPAARRHTVARGDNASTVARRYGVGVTELLRRNGLATGSVLKPGKVLQIDPLLPMSAIGPE